MDDYSLSSISNNGSFLAFPMINKKQILLDWINTINEPMCLLVSDMEQLKDGKVFVEILKHFLQREGMVTSFIKDINASDKMSPIQRVLLVIEVMSKVDNNKMVKKKFEKFLNCHLRLFKDDDFLLDFVALLRIIFEKELDNEVEEDQPRSLVHHHNNNNYNNEDDIIVQSGTFRNENNYNQYHHLYDNQTKGEPQMRTEQYNANADDNNASYNDKYYSQKSNQKNKGDDIDNEDDYHEEMLNEDIERRQNYNEAYSPNNNYGNNNIKPIKNYQEKGKENFPKMNQNLYCITQTNYKKKSDMKELNTDTSSNNNNYIKNNNYHTIDNKQYERDSPFNHNSMLTTPLPQMEIAKNDQFDYHPQQREKKVAKQKQKPPLLSQQHRPITPIQKQNPPLYNHNNNLNDFDLSMISKKNSQVGMSDTSFYSQIDANKLYSKRRKAEINMVRGIQCHNKVFKLEHKNLMIPYLKLISPTQPITVVSNNQIIKYQVVTVSDKGNSKQGRKEAITNCQGNVIHFIPKPKQQQHLLQQHQDIASQPVQASKSLREKKPSILANIPMPHNHNESSSLRTNLNTDNPFISYNKHSNNLLQQMDAKGTDNIPIATKNKIYSWLIDVGILKDKSFGINELPNICINGVLLCDLVNRCEGRNECIHGIIRKTTTKSQIQVNVNKVLVYLRSIEKFSSRHLWSHNEIIQGHAQTIWQLLEDLFTFYSIKTKFASRSKSKINKIKIEQNLDQSAITQDPLIHLNLNEVTPFENNHYPTPLNHQVPSFINLRNPPSQQSQYSQHSLQQAMKEVEVMPKPLKRIQSYNQLKKTPVKNTSIPRCNTHNNINSNDVSIINSNSKPYNNISVLQKHNQSFQSQIPSSNNINGFLLFEKSTIKRLKQNIDQISGLNSTSHN